MDGMLRCGEDEKGIKIQCRLFRISTNPVDEKTDLEKMNGFLGKERIIEIKSQYVTSKTDYWHILVTFEDSGVKEDVAIDNKFVENNKDIDIPETSDSALVERLKEWRREQSSNRGWPAYRVLTNAVIEELAKIKPVATEQLRSIKGIGGFTVDNFGTDIINIITKHQEESRK